MPLGRPAAGGESCRQESIMKGIRMNQGKFWTARYAAINATYFMAFCGVHAYASVFLLDRGFTNSQIGILLAAANVLSVFIQPVVAGWIDKPGKLTNRNVSAVCTAILIVLSVFLAVVKSQKAVIFVVFLLIYMIQMAYQPIMIAMNFEYVEAGCNINFGLARGLGSAGFAVFSPVIGTLLGHYDVSVIHIGDALALSVGLLFLLTFMLPKRAGEGCEEESRTKKTELAAHNNFFDFARHYPRFMLFLLATICFFLGHNALNDYLIQIITPLGGTEKHIGYATAMAAILELPTMAFFAKMAKKVDCGNLLKLSGMMFTVKILLMFFAQNIIGVLVSQFFQISAYALFIPASAYYVNKIMEQLDQVKGQAYVNCAITIGGVFSGLVCGRVLDLAGPKVMLAIGAAVSLAGTILGIFVVKKVDKLS